MYKQIFLGVFFASAILAFVGSPAQAATSPSLGVAESYSVLSGANATNGGAGITTISGNLGVDPAAAYNDAGTTVFLTPGNPHLADTSAHDAQVAQKAVFDGPLDFVAQPCTVTYAVHTELSTVGPLVPGVYCTDPGQDFTLSGTLTLQGTGSPSTDVWIFRSSRDLIGSGTANVVFTGTGGLPCNVWWRVANTATFTANNAMVGNILAASSIALGQSATLNGRAFAYTGAVTMLGNTISGPVCAATVVTPPAGSNTPAPIINVRKVPNPLALPNGPGPVTFTYTVTNPTSVVLTQVTLIDDKCSTTTFVGGDTNGNTYLESNETWTYTCTTVLAQTSVNYATARAIGNGLAAVDTAITQVVVGVAVVPPLINIVKTPDPLALPFNGGSVTYHYAVTNPGTVPLSNVTVIDDRCGAMTFVSGDGNSNGMMEVSEAWAYTCTMLVPQTITNTVIATGQANGLTAVDTALATVVVAGLPVPPLVHLIKKPEPVVLPSTGGWATYTYEVTNPGVVPLTTVGVGDDTCGPVTFVGGDANSNGYLESNETWTYTCAQYLQVSTNNIAVAQASGNGLTVTNASLASIALSTALIPPPPILPQSGFDPNRGKMAVLIGIGGLAAIMLLFIFGRRQRRS